MQERPDEAIAAFRAIGEESPFFWYARLSVASLLAGQDGGTDEAIDMLEAMLDERAERYYGVRALGDVLRV